MAGDMRSITTAKKSSNVAAEGHSLTCIDTVVGVVLPDINERSIISKHTEPVVGVHGHVLKSLVRANHLYRVKRLYCVYGEY